MSRIDCGLLNEVFIKLENVSAILPGGVKHDLHSSGFAYISVKFKYLTICKHTSTVKFPEITFLSYFSRVLVQYNNVCFFFFTS